MIASSPELIMPGRNSPAWPGPVPRTQLAAPARNGTATTLAATARRARYVSRPAGSTSLRTTAAAPRTTPSTANGLRIIHASTDAGNVPSRTGWTQNEDTDNVDAQPNAAIPAGM